MKMELSKLKKMKMPASKKAAPELEMEDGEEKPEEDMDMELPELEHEDSEEEGSPEEEAAESPEEEKAEDEPLDLSSLSDEELMAELKKRGLMAKLK
jgi:hypothetical protein